MLSPQTDKAKHISLVDACQGLTVSNPGCPMLSSPPMNGQIWSLHHGSHWLRREMVSTLILPLLPMTLSSKLWPLTQISKIQISIFYLSYVLHSTYTSYDSYQYFTIAYTLDPSSPHLVDTIQCSYRGDQFRCHFMPYELFRPTFPSLEVSISTDTTTSFTQVVYHTHTFPAKTKTP